MCDLDGFTKVKGTYSILRGAARIPINYGAIVSLAERGVREGVAPRGYDLAETISCSALAAERP